MKANASQPAEKHRSTEVPQGLKLSRSLLPKPSLSLSQFPNLAMFLPPLFLVARPVGMTSLLLVFQALSGWMGLQSGLEAMALLEGRDLDTWHQDGPSDDGRIGH
jgi:hypothetical protein